MQGTNNSSISRLTFMLLHYSKLQTVTESAHSVYEQSTPETNKITHCETAMYTEHYSSKSNTYK